MPMQIDEKHLTIAGFILTWLTGVFCGGIIYGRISAKVDKHDRALFTPDGDLRVVTYPAHDIMVEKCNKIWSRNATRCATCGSPMSSPRTRN